MTVYFKESISTILFKNLFQFGVERRKNSLQNSIFDTNGRKIVHRTSDRSSGDENSPARTLWKQEVLQSGCGSPIKRRIARLQSQLNNGRWTKNMIYKRITGSGPRSAIRIGRELLMLHRVPKQINERLIDCSFIWLSRAIVHATPNWNTWNCSESPKNNATRTCNSRISLLVWGLIYGWADVFGKGTRNSGSWRFGMWNKVENIESRDTQ
jgi:hypothetical protein